MGATPKNPAEIAAMREGGKILGQILTELESIVAPGMCTLDLEKHAEKLFKQYGVKPGFKGYNGYPAILCTSVNNEVVHGIPNTIPLEKGDILSIDCGVIYKDLNTDSAVAVIVGGETAPVARRLVDTCIRALWKGIAQVKPGNTLGDIGYAIQKTVEAEGFTIIKELTGHGIGYRLHEEPFVFNYGKKGMGDVLKAGMTLAIEPIIGLGTAKIDTLDDDWTIVTRDGSLAIQHEHTILVTETGVEVLTLRAGERTI